MLPCPILTDQKDGKTHLSTMLPSVMGTFFPGKGIQTVAALVKSAVLSIVDESAK